MTSKENLEANFSTLADPNRGRLVIVGRGENNNWRLFTGMGGRSDRSKNRYYQQLSDLSGHGDFVKTAIHNRKLSVGDEAATLYIAQRNRMGWHVASNGEQTEGICVALAISYSLSKDEGVYFKQAQDLYENEGRDNGYTARITAAVHNDGAYALCGKILSKLDNPECSDRYLWVVGLVPGEAAVLYTYDGKGGLGPDYASPRKILLPGTLEENMDLIWDKWDLNTKAGLVGKEIKRGSYNGNKGSERFTYSFRSIHPGRT